MDSSSTDIYVMIISGTMVLLILVVFIISFLFIYKNRQLRHKVEMESVKEKYNQEILRAQLEIKEQTLKNISEEIHDNVGQVLSLAVLSLSAVDLGNADKAAAKIEHVTRLVEKAVADLRNLSKTLDHENIASRGLVAIIKFEMDLLEKTGIYKTSFELDGTEKKLTAEKEIVVYRIIQESLNNIIKHAKATFIGISVSFSDAWVNVKIVDNGLGFVTSGGDSKKVISDGAGLKNMERRAKLIGGTIDIVGTPSGGTVISLMIPY